MTAEADTEIATRLVDQWIRDRPGDRDEVVTACVADVAVTVATSHLLAERVDELDWLDFLERVGDAAC